MARGLRWKFPIEASRDSANRGLETHWVQIQRGMTVVESGFGEAHDRDFPGSLPAAPRTIPEQENRARGAAMW
jgi:hypothetical protein